MSRFAVFGMTKTFAKTKADRLSPYMNETPEQYAERHAKEFNRHWNSIKSVKVSNLFDAPQFAQEFIRVGEASGDLRNGDVRVHTELDKVSKKTGKPKRKWTNWEAA